MSSPRRQFMLAFSVIASLLFSSSVYGQITWNATYTDVTNGLGLGFGSTAAAGSTTVGQLRRDSAVAAFNYMNTILDGRGTVNINWNKSFNDTDNLPPGSVLASFGYNYNLPSVSSVPGAFVNGEIYQRARTNTGFNTVSGSGQVNFKENAPNAINWHYDVAGTNTTATGRYDLVSVLAHEIGHGLGFISVSSPDGIGAYGQSLGSRDVFGGFDRGLQQGSVANTNRLFNTDVTQSNFSTFRTSVGIGAYTGGNTSSGGQFTNTTTGLYFGGTYTNEVFNGPVPIYSPTTNAPGSTGSHVNVGPLAAGSTYGAGAVGLMNFNIPPSTKRRFQAYEIAMMFDMGWNVFNWNANTTGGFGNNTTTLANTNWRTDVGIMRVGTTNYNQNSAQAQAPVLPVYGQVTANIILNFAGTAGYTATNDNEFGSIRLSRMNFSNTSSDTVTISNGLLNFGLNSNGTASVLVPKITQGGSSRLTISSNVQVNNIATQTLDGSTFTGHSRLTVEGTGTGLMTISGNILDGSGANAGGGLTKNSSTFNLVLTGTNTYTGTTIVNGGSLFINGNNSAATGAVTVNNAGTVLSGTGTVGGSITVNSGATLQAGNSAIGTLVVNNNVTIANSGTLRSELGASSTADRINMSNGNNILALNSGAIIGLTAAGFAGGTNTLTFLLADLNGTTSTLLTVNGANVAADTTIATFTSTGGNAGTDDNAHLSFSLTGFNFDSGNQLQLRRDAVGDLVLVFVPVPEPVLLFGGVVILVGLARVGRMSFAKRASTPLAA